MVLRQNIGPYRLSRKLGEGGMGEVYEALHEALERQVAIKLLRPEYSRNKDAIRRFFNEARAANRVRHPCMVQVSDFGQLEDGTTYIVMEYLSGETLGRRLKRSPSKLPLSLVLHITWQVASALAAAHEKGIVHRDLKPENIMLVPDAVTPTGERARLLDFGLAKLTQDASSQVALTRSNHIMGTPLYMSPEQCRGSGIVDDKTDVYSLGVMLYQMLAGHPPFVAAGAGELISRHLSDAPPTLATRAPHAPPELAALVHTLLCKDRAQRPSMRHVVEQLEQLEARQGSSGAGSTVLIRPAPQNSGVPDQDFRALLAGVLDPEVELESQSDSLLDSAQPGNTLGNVSPAAGQTVPPTTLLSIPTVLSGATRLLPAEQRASATAPRRKLRNLALAYLFGCSLVATAEWLRQPSHQRGLRPPSLPEVAAAPVPSVPLESGAAAAAIPPPEPLRKETALAPGSSLRKHASPLRKSPPPGTPLGQRSPALFKIID